MNLEQKIEAVLFYENGPVEIKRLCKLLDIKEGELKEALKNLSDSCNSSSRGIMLLDTGSEVSLATKPETKELLEQIAKDDMRREIGKAGLETLAIVLYSGPISRREIDYIRGVNSNFILRNLTTRGLVDREPNPKDQRTFIYKGSISLLSHLGIESFDKLPEFGTFKEKLEEVIENKENTEEEI